MSVDHYENFPVASRLVPAPMRGAVVAIYRFARAADDIADEGEATATERLAALARFHAELDMIERGETPRVEPFPALAEAIRRHALPLRPFRDLLNAFAQDVTVKRYDTFSRLLDYCSRSANPVGRLMLALYQTREEPALRASDAICSGLQLANFWQDVAVDWDKGRIYLPREDLQRFGVAEAQVGQGNMQPGWSALMHFQTARTRSMLVSGRTLLAHLPLRLRLEIGAVIAGGLRILDRIDAVDGDVFAKRPTLDKRDWALVGASALRFGVLRMTP